MSEPRHFASKGNVDYNGMIVSILRRWKKDNVAHIRGKK
jgi:hypothetical protein